MTSTDIIETRAVTVMNDFFNYQNRIKPYINEDDREISFDGKVVLFSADTHTTSNYWSSVPVQVKGSEVEKLDDNEASFSRFNVDTFNNFQREDGTLVFYVEFLKSNPRIHKIFWKFLDATTLEKIVSGIIENDQNTTTIKLVELDDQTNFTSMLQEIAVQRKVNGFANVKYMNHTINADKQVNDTFSLAVIEKMESVAAKFEYIDPASELNIQLIEKILELLKHFPNIDSIELSVIHYTTQNMKNFELLPNETKVYVQIINILYLLMGNDIDDAKDELLELSSNIEKLNIEKLQSILNLLRFWCQLKKDSEGVAMEALSSDSSMIIAMWAFIDGNEELFSQILQKRYVNNALWDKMLGYRYLQVDVDKALEYFTKSNKELPSYEVEFNKLKCRWIILLEMGINRSKTELKHLLTDINKFCTRVEARFKVGLTIIEKMQFEIDLLLNPIEGLERINTAKLDFIQENIESYRSYWKMKLLYETDCVQELLQVYDNIPFKNRTNQIILLKFRVLLDNFDTSAIEQMIDELLREKINDKRVIQVIIRGYIQILPKLDSSDQESTEGYLQNIIEKYCSDDGITLLLFEETLKKINWTEQGTFFSKIVEESTQYSLQLMIQLESSLQVIDNISFTKLIYKKVHVYSPLKASEILGSILVTKGDYDGVLEVTNEFTPQQLTEKLLTIRSIAYNEQKQFDATIRLYEKRPNGSEMYLTQVLIAKRENNEASDIKNLAEQLSKSKNYFVKVNALLTLVQLKIDIPGNIMLIERLLLSNWFDDHALNAAFVGTVLMLKKSDSWDYFEGESLRVVEITKENETQRVMIIPKEWTISDSVGIYVSDINSEFSMETRGLRVGDTFEMDDSKYQVNSIELLSSFVFQTALKKESGAFDSNKPIKVIEIGENFENLVAAMKRMDNSENIQKAIDISQNYESFMSLTWVTPALDMPQLFESIVQDKSFRLFLGKEGIFDAQKTYVISISALMILELFGMIKILKKFTNIVIEEGQRRWLHKLFDEKLTSKTDGKLILQNNVPVIRQDDDKVRRSIVDRYRHVVVAIDKMRGANIGEINEGISKIDNWDSKAIQLALDKHAVLITADNAWQKIIPGEFEGEVTSVMTLISCFLLSQTDGSTEYANLMIEMFKNNNGWEMSSATISTLVDQLEYNKLAKVYSIYKSFLS